MENREPVAWITVNGNHVPLFEGESKQDAVNRSVAERNEAAKEKQIARNKAEADVLNGKTKGMMKTIQDKLSQPKPDYDDIANDINDNTETGGYFSTTDKDGKVTIWGKVWNDHFLDITPEHYSGIQSRLKDSVDMAKIIKDAPDAKWSLHKFDGKVDFPAKALKPKAPANAMYNAIVLQDKPTNAKLKKIITSPDGKYDIYQLQNTGSDMFQYVAYKKKS